MLRLVLLLLALAGTASAADSAGGWMERVLQRGRLVVGVKADYPPWGMVASDGRIVGLEADLAQDLAARLGVALELVPVTASNRLSRLEQGVVDVVIATLGDTAERRRISDLLRPHYYASGVNLLAPPGTPFHDWGQLRGRSVCLVDGAYFNRQLTERYLIDPVTFPGNRDALMALRDGRCVGWAFDDTVIGQLLLDPEWAGYAMAMPTILSTPWSIAVRKGEGDGDWGRFVADAIAEWHRSGRLVELQAKWRLQPNAFLAEQRVLWSDARCLRGANGRFPAECVGDDAVVAGSAPLPRWARALHGLGLDPAPFLDRFDRDRLIEGAWLTLTLSLTAIAGCLAVGVAFAWADRSGGWALRAPLRAVVAVARMTPPLLQLYILFFGLGGLLAARGITLGSFTVAAVVLSLYAGATNTVLLRAALAQVADEYPGLSTRRLMPLAVERAYEGLVATCVNIVKAAGLASTIALPETVSVVNTILTEGRSPTTMMNLLLVYYFLFVLAVLGLLRAGRGLVLRLT
jgi:His/Glu/Gln/Arg/opine family amino acid ABC transporter permease subunit